MFVFRLTLIAQTGRGMYFGKGLKKAWKSRLGTVTKISQCGIFWTFASCRFYVKSMFEILGGSKFG